MYYNDVSSIILLAWRQEQYASSTKNIYVYAMRCTVLNVFGLITSRIIAPNTDQICAWMEDNVLIRTIDKTNLHVCVQTAIMDRYVNSVQHIIQSHWMLLLVHIF